MRDNSSSVYFCLDISSITAPFALPSPKIVLLLTKSRFNQLKAAIKDPAPYDPKKMEINNSAIVVEEFAVKDSSYNPTLQL